MKIKSPVRVSLFSKLAAAMSCAALLWVASNTLSLHAKDADPAASPSAIKPPLAEKIPHTAEVHGQKRIDNYFWLRDRKNPKVIDHLKAENEYTAAMLKHTEALKKKLYDEFLSRIEETDTEVPAPLDGYFYYTRTEKGKNYAIHCRKKKTLEAPEEIILDENELAAKHKQFALGIFDVSPNHNLLAYSTDTTGAEEFTLQFKDLTTGKMLEDKIEDTADSYSWSSDNKTVFYVKRDDAQRPYQLWRHVLGTHKADELVYEEKDEKFGIGIGLTSSQKYLVLVVSSKQTSEVHFLESDRAAGMFKTIATRKPGVEYGIEHHGDKFFILTNEEAVNFKLMEAPVTSPEKEHWKEFIPHRKEILLEGIEIFSHHMVIQQREEGTKTLVVRNFDTGKSHSISFPEPAYTLAAGPNLQYDTPILRFTYSSPITPASVYDYNMNTQERVLMKQRKVLGGYDSKQYAVEKIFAKSEDGTRVPITMVYKKGMKREGANPCLLYAYGSYGMSEDDYFSGARLSLLDRGFIYAVAHVRGGGEMGRPWYDNGKLLNKKNTFRDFIACAEHLIAEKYTSSNHLAIEGGSAGGMLVGAVLNMRPELFRAAVAEVPFVDVVNTMLDPSLPLTVPEYEEWGNPENKTYFDYIHSYSPYDNVRAQRYPHMLVLAGLNDSRVAYWEPAKWVAKLRTIKTDDNWLLLKTNMDAGHAGSSGRYVFLEETAMIYAFVIDRLGVKP